MIPVSYIMVDLGGIDLADVKGNVYPGLYNKIYSSLNECQEVILCNWFVAGILIPPAYCDIDISVSGTISFNDMIFIHSDDTIEIPTMGTTPKIESLNVTENGTYEVSGDIDGYSPVNVNVPPPELSDIVITENGIYEPAIGVNGYKKITVNVEGGAMDLLFTSNDDVGVDYSNVILTKPCTDYDEILIICNLIVSGGNHYVSSIGISTISASNRYSFNASSNYLNLYFTTSTTFGRFNISGNWKVVRVLGVKNNT